MTVIIIMIFFSSNSFSFSIFNIFNSFNRCRSVGYPENVVTVVLLAGYRDLAPQPVHILIVLIAVRHDEYVIACKLYV